MFAVSDTLMRSDKGANPNHSHSFDTGAAWAMLALQAEALGYHTHGMSGVDFAKAQVELGVPDDFRIEAAIAIGRKDSPEKLPEGLREREVISGRKAYTLVSVAGKFGDLPG